MVGKILHELASPVFNAPGIPPPSFLRGIISTHLRSGYYCAGLFVMKYAAISSQIRSLSASACLPSGAGSQSVDASFRPPLLACTLNGEAQEASLSKEESDVPEGRMGDCSIGASAMLII